MTILKRIRDKAQQALTGVGNFIDRDKGMAGVQLAQGGLGNRVSSALSSANQANNQASNWAINQPTKAVGNFALGMGQSIARSVPGVTQTAVKASAPLFGVNPDNIADEIKVSDLFPGNKYGRYATDTLFGKDQTIRTIPKTQNFLESEYNIPAPLALGLAIADPVTNLIPGGGLTKSGAKKVAQEGAERVLREGGEAIVREVVEKGAKQGAKEVGGELLEKTAKAVAMNPPKIGSIEQIAEAGHGWIPGMKQAFDSAILNKDVAVIKQLLPDVPAYYKKQFAKNIDEIVKQAPETIEAVLKGGDDAVKQTINTLQSPVDSFRRWVNTREGFANWRGGDIKRNPLLTAFDNEGMAAIKELQSGADPAKYADIGRFTDELFDMEKRAGLIDPSKYRKNYLPQLWDNTPEEIQQVFGKTVGKAPGFTKARLFDDYAAGIEAGLTPRFSQISDLLEARFKTATRALADRDFVKSLIDSGNAVPLGDAPKGWISIPQVMDNGKPLAIPKTIADKITTYVTPPTAWLEKIARAVSEVKQTVLSAGVPYSGVNYHTGVNIPARASMIRNPFSGTVDSAIWNFNPKSAEQYIDKAPDEIVDGLLLHGATLSRTAEASGYGFKPEAGKSLISKGRTWIDKAFSETAFDKILPAHKIKAGWEIYNRAVKEGSSSDEAFEIAAKAVNDGFGGINTAELARNKDFQNVLRVFFLAPDWLESNTKLALKTGSLLNPGNWGNKALAPYKRLALNATAMYGTMAITNKFLSGHYPWENGAGQEFNLATGQFDERGREIMIPVFGTAFDAFRIPYTIISGIVQNDPQAITNIVKNRLSPIAGAGVALASNSDYRGREIVSKDKTPLQNILGVGGQVATAVGMPSQITNTAQFLAGNTTPLEYGAGLLEAPLRFRGGANTEAKRKQADTLKASGLSNKEIAAAVSSKPQGGGLFGLFGGDTPGAPPAKTATRQEKEDYNKSINAALDSGSIPDVAALKYSFFNDKTATSKSIEERTKVYTELNKVMADEYYTEEQKAAVLEASGADPKEAEYFALAVKDQDVRLQELLPKLENMDDKELVTYLMKGRRAVGGKQLVSNTMVDYLYENDYISEDAKTAIKATLYDEIKGEFYWKKSFKSGGGDKLTYKQALALFKIDLPKFSEMKGIDALLDSYSQGATQTSTKGDTLLDDILYKAPLKRTRFLS